MEAPYPPPALDQSKVEGALLFADRNAALSIWPKNATIAEVGVAYGAFTYQILSRTKPKLFHAYDLFRLHEHPELWGRPTREIFENKTQRSFYETRFAQEISEGRLQTFEGDSSIELAKQREGTYDVIYIDGDHTFRGVMRDTSSAIKVLKRNGILIFNDYILYDKQGKKYGVVPVVNELCLNHGWRVLYLALNREMFCDIALIRI